MSISKTLKRWVALGLAGMSIIWTATTAQAQLYIDVYPSQDSTNQTLWIFRGSSTAHYGSSIRSSGNYHARDSWRLTSGRDYSAANIYTANKPTNQLFNLTPLFSSTNNPKDIESVRSRLYGSPGSYSSIFSTNSIWFYNDNVTNAPTVRIGDTDKIIGNLFMNDTANYDEIGIRGAPPNNLVYTNGQRSHWFGLGILNKPFSDFIDSSSWGTGVEWARLDNEVGSPYFVGRAGGLVGIVFRR